MAKPLDRYDSKRDFTRTPEPAPEADRAQADGRRFVVQEHHASHLHWDFRLEHHGVLVSWAVPKGLPVSPRENRLAIQTEDHPLSYAHFSGRIPEGNYGAGTVVIWDEGSYDCHKFQENEVLVTLHGSRAQGRYVLFRTRGRQWMMHRMDPPADSWEPMPDLDPMLATPGTIPEDAAQYALEVKWDGVRTIARIDGGRVRLLSRNRQDVTERYPEIRPLGELLGSRSALLDGEIVVLDERGRPDFQRLQQRMGVQGATARRRALTDPVTYVIFDLLYLEGARQTDHPYHARRAALEALRLEGPAWRTPAYRIGEAEAFLRAASDAGLEGIMAKRLESVYRPGRRSHDWLKIKSQGRQEFVIGGWAEGKTHPLGALLLGYFDDRGSDRMCYAGRVGTGFSQSLRHELYHTLQGHEIRASPFAEPVRGAGVHFVQPVLVAEVEFTEWTRSGTLRHPSFKGLRDDKNPRAVVREQPG